MCKTKKYSAALIMLLMTGVFVYGQAEDLSYLGIRSWNLRNIYQTVFVPIEDNIVPIRVKKAKEPGAVTLYMDGIRGKVSFNPNNKLFEPGVAIPMKADPETADMMTSEDDLYKILRAEVENAPNCDQIIIAHSQGGQRAIAYANIMNQLGLADRIKGIIFVGSPVKGWYTMSHSDSIAASHNPNLDVTDPYALNVFKQNLNNTIDIVVNLGKYAKKHFGWADAGLGNAVDAFTKTIREGTLNDLLGATDAALINLGPKSEFAKKLLGVDYATPLRGFWLGKYYENDKSSYRQVLPAHIKVGFVVGTDSGLWDMLGDSNQRYWLHYLLDNNWAKTQNYIGDLNDLLTAWGTDAIAKANENYSRHWITAAERDERVLDAGYIVAFQNWVLDYRKHGNSKILKSYYNDGVVATFSQSRTIEQIGGKPIAPNYIVTVPATHAGQYEPLSEIGTMPQIWSDGEWRDSEIVLGSGIVSQWYSENEANSSTPEERNSWKMARKNWVTYF